LYRHDARNRTSVIRHSHGSPFANLREVPAQLVTKLPNADLHDNPPPKVAIFLNSIIATQSGRARGTVALPAGHC
jgi:hypothetical protein